MNTDRRGFIGLIGALGGAALVPWTKQKPKPLADPIKEINRALTKSFEEIDARQTSLEVVSLECWKDNRHHVYDRDGELIEIISWGGHWEHVIDAATCACVKCGIRESQLHEQGAFSVTGVKARTVGSGFEKLTTYTVYPLIT